jgi:hypothetical protein
MLFQLQITRNVASKERWKYNKKLYRVTKLANEKKSVGLSPHFRLQLYKKLIKKTVEGKDNILMVDHL